MFLLTLQIWNTAGLQQPLYKYNLNFSCFEALPDQESELNEKEMGRSWMIKQSDELGRQFGNIVFPGIFANSNLTVNLLPALLVAGLLLLLTLPLLGTIFPSLFGGLAGGAGSSKCKA